MSALTGPDMSISRSRRVADAAFWTLCAGALLAVVVPTGWMVGGVLARALPGWRWSVLTSATVGESGGLAQAVLGTLLIVGCVTVVAGTVSVLTGIYLAEFAGGRRRALLRTSYEVLSGIPSIVLGYVGYVALVLYFHWSFSLGAAVVVLSVLTMPYMVKATEGALAQVPTSYREGAEALGIGPGWALRRIVLPTALPGIATGLVLAVAIAVGETAPLLYTAGWTTNLPSLHPTHAPVAYLTYPIWTFFNQPSTAAQQLSYDAALILLVLVLGLLGAARLLVRLGGRHAQSAG